MGGRTGGIAVEALAAEEEGRGTAVVVARGRGGGRRGVSSRRSRGGGFQGRRGVVVMVVVFGREGRRRVRRPTPMKTQMRQHGSQGLLQSKGGNTLHGERSSYGGARAQTPLPSIAWPSAGRL
ncbi:hypothetical protein VTK73DRAFT_6455 [Phialemonium thermophilum]|uniref:Uncharacterized protein n=1 Tax=Phialemonium thermophilum TaxID=223376 RepID=A0ABR3UZG3_9PEZI